MLPIIKHELEDIVFNKRYMVGFIVQLLLLITLVPIFSSQLAESNPGLLTPDVKEFIPIGVMPISNKSSILMHELLSEEKLDVTIYHRNPMDKLMSGEIAALVVIPRAYDEEAIREIPVWLIVSSSNPKRESVSDVLITLFARASKKISEERKEKLGIKTSEPITIKRKLLKPPLIEKDGNRFSSFFIGYLIPIALFFPIFMSGGLIIDSVVGEKEKKTIESLLSVPIRRGWIIVGKIAGIYSWISLQCLIWLVILRVFGIPFSNFWGIFIFLSLTNLAAISTAFALAVYSSNVKEANISLMLFYVFVFMSLIVSLSLEFFNPRGFYDFIPFNIISSLSVGESINTVALVVVPLLLLLYSLSLLRINIGLFSRDDIIFGPRPPVGELFDHGIEAILKKFEKSPVLGRCVISIFSGVLALPLSFVLQMSIGLTLLYFLGYSVTVIVILVLVFALIEEILKPMALFSPKMAGEKFLGLYGSLAGLAFFAAESFFIAFLSFFSMPWPVYRIITLRMGTTLLVHVVSSGIVGRGISKGRWSIIYILAATTIHAAYNLAIIGGG
jgi:ABC-2 type transport system permease protein